MNENDEYAFPYAAEWGCQNGMTLRDYFAIHATNQDIDGYRDAYLADDGVVEYRRTNAQARYAFADAMLAARKS